MLSSIINRIIPAAAPGADDYIVEYSLPRRQFPGEEVSLKKAHFLTILFSVLIVLLAACSSGAPVETAPPATQEALSTATPPAPTPTATATALPERVLLVYNPDSGFASGSELQAALENLAQSSGWQLDTLSELAAEDLDPGVRIVIVTPPAAGAAELAAANPQIQFVVVGMPGLEPASNLSLIGPQGERPDWQGFLAGFIAAVITEDWRVGVLGANDLPAGQAASLAFLQGVTYFCGLCNPYFGPIVDYPQSAQLPASASLAEWQAAADSLVNPNVAVRTIFTAPGAQDPQLQQYLADRNVFLIGAGSPPAALEPRWVASVGANPVPALEKLWPELAAGNGGLVEPMPVGYWQVNAAIFSPGRQLVVDEMLQDLQAGLIDTGVDPLTGEFRVEDD